jgi:uncharacterized membrane protein (UPF0127 family)
VRFRLALAALLALAVLAGVVTTFVSAAGDANTATTRLLLDRVSFRPELAMSSEERSLGLMHRTKAPRDGMLFVFPYDTTGGFWMKNTLVPLTIVFFNRNGERVRRLSMKPCRADPCAIYHPRRRYRFALELPASDKRAADLLGPPAKLDRLSRQAE